MIIGISGKIGSGKDTVGRIIQYLTSNNVTPSCYTNLITGKSIKSHIDSNWEVRKFADKLKDIVCLLIGCTREELEDSEFKNKPLGEDWIRYAYADGFKKFKGETEMLSIECDKEKYEHEELVNWQTAYKTEFTPRMLLQRIGTDLFRNQLLQNIWVNATLADYKKVAKPQLNVGMTTGNIGAEYPNIIITDVRFPNEVKAIKDKGGIVIRIESDYVYYDNSLIYALRNASNEIEHESETALDDYEFDVIVNNNGNIINLIDNIINVLDQHNIEYNEQK